MVYGVLKLINFAHGDVFMVGAMMGWYMSARWTGEARNPNIGGALLVTLFSMLVCGCLGFVIERAAYRPLRNAPRLNSLITAIGVSFFLEYGGQYLFGPNPRVFGVLPRGTALHFGPVSLGYVDVVTIIVSVALMIVLQRIVFHTRMGTAMRAVSFNASVAALANTKRAALNWVPFVAAIPLLWVIQHFFAEQPDWEYAFQNINHIGIAIILAVSLNLVNGLTGQFSIGHAGFMAVGGYVSAVLLMRGPTDDPYRLFFICSIAGGAGAAALAGWLGGKPSLRLRGD